jgi:hypothetical protein
VGRRNHPLFGPSVLAGDPHGITQFLASQRMPASDPYGLVHTLPISGWAMALIPFVTTNLQRYNIVLFRLPLKQTSQEVTHPSTTPAKTRLTVEF